MRLDGYTDADWVDSVVDKKERQDFASHWGLLQFLG